MWCVRTARTPTRLRHEAGAGGEAGVDDAADAGADGLRPRVTGGGRRQRRVVGGDVAQDGRVDGHLEATGEHRRRRGDACDADDT